MAWITIPWENPHEFQSVRFSIFKGDPFDSMPNGGDDLAKGRCCPYKKTL